MLSFVAQVIGAWLAWLVGDVLRIRRDHAVAALSRAGIADPALVARRMYRNLGRGLGELVAMALTPRRPVLGRTVKFDPALLEALPVGQPVVLATAHTGNWDLLACAAAEQAPLTVVTKHLRVGFLDRMWQAARARRGVRLVASGSARREVAAALARGERVAMMVDQAPERTRGTTRCQFLGAAVQVDLGPALLAQRARVPLAAVFALRRADGSHSACHWGSIAPPARPSHEWAERSMQQVTLWLDEFVRQHPDQWLWMHRRWKQGPRRPAQPTPELRRGAGSSA